MTLKVGEFEFLPQPPMRNEEWQAQLAHCKAMAPGRRQRRRMSYRQAVLQPVERRADDPVPLVRWQ